MNKSEFLNQDEVSELTGFLSPRKQKDWLDANGYVYQVNANGRPILSRVYVRARLSGLPVTGSSSAEPDFSAVA